MGGEGEEEEGKEKELKIVFHFANFTMTVEYTLAPVISSAPFFSHHAQKNNNNLKKLVFFKTMVGILYHLGSFSFPFPHLT